MEQQGHTLAMRVQMIQELGDWQPNKVMLPPTSQPTCSAP